MSSEGKSSEGKSPAGKSPAGKSPEGKSPEAKAERQKKIPGEAHPISVTHAGARMRVTWRGETIADSAHALVMHEAAYGPVYYFPRADVAMEKLTSTSHESWCPYKGAASYFSLPDAENAVWSYETPFEAMREIAGLVAFYPNKVDAITRADM